MSETLQKALNCLLPYISIWCRAILYLTALAAISIPVVKKRYRYTGCFTKAGKLADNGKADRDCLKLAQVPKLSDPSELKDISVRE